jgi:putative PIN family toxin of toxin-antitoxin system
MKVILDTNVFVSGVFFSGPPYRILEAWRDGKIQLVMSQEILDEYRRIGKKLAEQFPNVDLEPILDLVTMRAEMFSVRNLRVPACKDPDDDKFLACALASKCKVIVSGDKNLLRVSGFRGIKVIRPRNFVDEYL